MARDMSRARDDDDGDDDGGGTDFPTPIITGVNPASGTPGTLVTITGLQFGGRTNASVSFIPDGLDGAEAEIVSWAAKKVEARVPSIQALGAAGIGTVALQTKFGEGDSGAFTVLDTVAPRISGFNRASSLPGDELRIYGEHFGVGGTPGTWVTFAGVGVPVLWWSPGEIAVRAPALAAVGGAGDRPAVVGAPWGQSAPGSFTLLDPPAIGAVTPAEAPPDAEIVVTGVGFGAFAPGQSAAVLQLTVAETGELVETAMDVLGWTPTEVRAVVPGLDRIKATGPKDVLIRMPLATSPPAAFEVIDIGSITSWTRIEPHARSEDVQAGLAAGMRAEVADALWLLGRQWTLGELQGENRGSPVVARIEGESAPLRRWRPGRDGPAADLPPGAPLEAVVEREPVFGEGGEGPLAFGDRRLAVEAGLQFLRILAANVTPEASAERLRSAFLERYALSAPGEDERKRLDPGSARFLALAAGRVPDGALMYGELRSALPPERGGSGTLPDKPQIPRNERGPVLEAVAAWFDWCEQLAAEPAQDQATWDPMRLEYAFAVSADGFDGEIVLEAPEYFEGRLDWPAFVRSPGGALGGEREEAAPHPIAATVIPSPATYPGMPAARWWEMEDRRVDFGSVDAGPPDLVRLLFIEFASVFGNDWFTIPVDGVPAGSISRITSLSVTDTFGETTNVPIFRETGPGGAWRMFQLTGDEERRELLVLPPTIVGGLESAPIEDVALLRDELANMAWAIERIVTGPGGRPVRRHEAEQQARARADAGAPAPSAAGTPAYRLMTSVPESWIPFVPQPQNGARWLLRAAMRRPAPGGSGALEAIDPLGAILRSGVEPFRLRDEEVPRGGAVVTRTWQLARGAGGGTHLWIGRRKQAGSGEGSSGLRFDVIDEAPGP